MNDLEKLLVEIGQLKKFEMFFFGWIKFKKFYLVIWELSNLKVLDFEGVVLIELFDKIS